MEDGGGENNEKVEYLLFKRQIYYIVCMMLNRFSIICGMDVSPH